METISRNRQLVLEMKGTLDKMVKKKRRVNSRMPEVKTWLVACVNDKSFATAPLF